MRLQPSSSLICIVDIQEKLLSVIPDADRVIARTKRIITAAHTLKIPQLVTEQYPKGLGPTSPAIATYLPDAIPKMSFSCCGSQAFRKSIPSSTQSVVLCGLETHICVSQTAHDLLADGYGVFLAVDAVASRHAIDHTTALRRLESAGAVLTTTESILFEWCASAEHPSFQSIRKLILDDE